MYYVLITIIVVIAILLLRPKKTQPKEQLKFIDLNEHNGKLFNDLAHDSLRFGDNEKAIYYFTKAIELKPNAYNYYLERGKLYWRLELTSLAIIDWKAAEALGSLDAIELLKSSKPVHQARVEKASETETLLNDFGIQFIYHMTHKSNLGNILQNGLLSHNKAHSKGLTKMDISDENVNRRRSAVHDYVPFYFNPKNPMLFRRKSIQSDIILLCVSRNLLKREFKFTDGNAASNSTKFFTDIKDLEKLNWSIINSEYWNDFADGKRIRCSEVLIPDKVTVDDIKKIYCFNSETRDYVKEKVGNREILVETNQNFYF